MKQQINSEITADEVSFSDIARVLVKQKKIFWSVFFVIVIIGVLSISIRQPVYKFSQFVELASYYNDDGRKITVIEPKVAASYVKKIFLPNYFAPNNKDINSLKIEESFTINSSGNNNLYFSIDGIMSQKSFVEQMFQNLIKQLSDNTQPLIQKKRDNLTLLIKDLKRQQEAQMTYERQDENAPSFNSDTTKKLLSYISVGQRLTIFSDLSSKIASLQFQLDTMRDTRYLSPMVVSSNPVGIAKIPLLILTIVLGLFAGFFAALFFEFFSKLKCLHGKEKQSV
jgi:hypothetical protein